VQDVDGADDASLLVDVCVELQSDVSADDTESPDALGGVSSLARGLWSMVGRAGGLGVDNGVAEAVSPSVARVDVPPWFTLHESWSTVSLEALDDEAARPPVAADVRVTVTTPLTQQRCVVSRCALPWSCSRDCRHIVRRVERCVFVVIAAGSTVIYMSLAV
jgi:hypothetical protein